MTVEDQNGAEFDALRSDDRRSRSQRTLHDVEFDGRVVRYRFRLSGARWRHTNPDQCSNVEKHHWTFREASPPVEQRQTDADQFR